MTSAAKPCLPCSSVSTPISTRAQRLFDLVRIPSISTDSAYKDFCRAAADHVAKDLESLGFEAAVRPTAGHPVVIGKSNGATAHEQRSARAVLRPLRRAAGRSAEPVEHAAVRAEDRQLPDGRKIIHGRGACDDKGQLMTFVEACRAFKAVTGKLPLDITMMIEGEEECGSKSLFDFVRTQCRRVQARPRAGLRHRHVGPKTPLVTTSLRGLLYEEVDHHLRGPRPAFRRVRRRRRQPDPHARRASSRRCTTRTAASWCPASTTA